MDEGVPKAGVDDGVPKARVEDGVPKAGVEDGVPNIASSLVPPIRGFQSGAIVGGLKLEWEKRRKRAF